VQIFFKKFTTHRTIAKRSVTWSRALTLVNPGKSEFYLKSKSVVNPWEKWILPEVKVSCELKWTLGKVNSTWSQSQLWTLVNPGKSEFYLKSKSVVNWLFIFWKIGSCAVACARRARDSDAALENVVTTLETFSMPTPNVLTSFLTKLRVCGVMVASATAGTQRCDELLWWQAKYL